ncbi:MAG: hypothetical protein ABIP67_14905 [Burkholderiales bacterium]
MRRYEDDGLDGLVDQRIGQVSARHVPVDQVLKVQDLYRNRYAGFTAKHFHEKLQEVNRIALLHPDKASISGSHCLPAKAASRFANLRRNIRPWPPILLKTLTAALGLIVARGSA